MQTQTAQSHRTIDPRDIGQMVNALQRGLPDRVISYNFGGTTTNAQVSGSPKITYNDLKLALIELSRSKDVAKTPGDRETQAALREALGILKRHPNTERVLGKLVDQTDLVRVVCQYASQHIQEAEVRASLGRAVLEGLCSSYQQPRADARVPPSPPAIDYKGLRGIADELVRSGVVRNVGGKELEQQVTTFMQYLDKNPYQANVFARIVNGAADPNNIKQALELYTKWRETQAVATVGYEARNSMRQIGDSAKMVGYGTFFLEAALGLAALIAAGSHAYRTHILNRNRQ